MDTRVPLVLLLASIACTACRTGVAVGLHDAPQATYVQVECLDVNGDHRLDAQDAVDASKLVDFDGDGQRDAFDAAFLQGINMPLDPATQAQACTRKNSDWGPEFFIAHPDGKPATVDCSSGAKAVLLVGAGGGVGNLKHREAMGVRSMIDALQRAYDARHIQTVAMVSGESVIAGVPPQGAMEVWMTNAVKTYLDHFPCLHAVLLGHSHGAVTMDVAASLLEAQYGNRFVELVNVDRVDILYKGDTESWPATVHVFNIYQTNDDKLKGAPRDAPNVENWLANDQLGPRDGDQGGPLQPVTHTTIDDSAAVRERILAEVLSRFG